MSFSQKSRKRSFSGEGTVHVVAEKARATWWPAGYGALDEHRPAGGERNEPGPVEEYGHLGRRGYEHTGGCFVICERQRTDQPGTRRLTFVPGWKSV
jgi:hypothetical protein